MRPVSLSLLELSIYVYHVSHDFISLDIWILVLRQIWRSITASYHHRELNRKYGCQFPRNLPQKDKVFASGVLLKDY